MRYLMMVVLLAVTHLAEAGSLQGRALYEEYLKALGLADLKSEEGSPASFLALRLIEEDASKISALTIKVRSVSGEMQGEISVHGKFSGRKTSTSINQRALSSEEISRIIELVNRRELMFLPAEFSACVGKSPIPHLDVSVELISKEFPQGNVLSRSIYQTDAVDDLRGLLVAIAHAPGKDWKIASEPAPSQSAE